MLQVGKHADALRMALKLGSKELAEAAFAGCSEPFYKKQVRRGGGSWAAIACCCCCFVVVQGWLQAGCQVAGCC